ncbi:hypothetical protein ASF44_10645 [Pseudorhodoferax sp. Leaf274]|nr:hypothetical protein ASF44_10645 [Pseudorhodoferax sp. Leaf274]
MPVSFSLGLYRCVRDPALYMRLLMRFLTTRLTMPQDIHRLWSQGEQEEARRVVHSAISSLGTIGALPLADVARALHVAMSSDPAGVPAQLDAFTREHALAVAAIRQYVERQG